MNKILLCCTNNTAQAPSEHSFRSCYRYKTQIIHVNWCSRRSRSNNNKKCDSYDCNCIIFVYFIQHRVFVFSLVCVLLWHCTKSHHLVHPQRVFKIQNELLFHWISVYFTSVLYLFFLLLVSCWLIPLLFAAVDAVTCVYKIFDKFYWITYRRIS